MVVKKVYNPILLKRKGKLQLGVGLGDSQQANALAADRAAPAGASADVRPDCNAARSGKRFFTSR